MKYILLFSFSLLFFHRSGAQELCEYLEKMQQAYRSDHLELDFRVRAIPQTGKDPKVIGYGTIKRSGEHYYSKFGAREMIISDKGMVVVDHSDQKMVYYRNYRYNIPEDKLMGDLEALTELADSLFILSRDQEFLTYKVIDRQGVISSAEIRLSLENYLVDKISYRYVPGSDSILPAYRSMEIEYTKASTQIISEREYFDLDRYVRDTGGDPAPVPEFKDYRFSWQEG